MKTILFAVTLGGAFYASSAHLTLASWLLAVASVLAFMDAVGE